MRRAEKLSFLWKNDQKSSFSVAFLLLTPTKSYPRSVSGKAFPGSPALTRGLSAHPRVKNLRIMSWLG